MKGLLQIIFIFSAVLATVSGLKCYVCTGTDETCSKDHSKESTCPFGMDRCMRIWGKKGDATTVASSCSNELLCKAAEDAKCNVDKCAVDCCDTDLCNAGSPNSPSNTLNAGSPNSPSNTLNAGSPVSFSVFLMTVCCTLGLAILK